MLPYAPSVVLSVNYSYYTISTIMVPSTILYSILLLLLLNKHTFIKIRNSIYTLQKGGPKLFGPFLGKYLLKYFRQL